MATKKNPENTKLSSAMLNKAVIENIMRVFGITRTWSPDKGKYKEDTYLIVNTKQVWKTKQNYRIAYGINSHIVFHLYSEDCEESVMYEDKVSDIIACIVSELKETGKCTQEPVKAERKGRKVW